MGREEKGRKDTGVRAAPGCGTAAAEEKEGTLPAQRTSAETCRGEAPRSGDSSAPESEFVRNLRDVAEDRTNGDGEVRRGRADLHQETNRGEAAAEDEGSFRYLVMSCNCSSYKRWYVRMDVCG